MQQHFFRALIVAIFAVFALAFAQDQQAQDPSIPDLPTSYLEGTVIGQSNEIVQGESKNILNVRLDSGQQIKVMDDTGGFRSGERIEIFQTWAATAQTINDQKLYYASDHIRRGSLLWLLGVFVLVTGLVGRAKGLRAIVGMLASLAIIVLVMVPLIVRGANPILVVIGGAALILAASVYFVHGINWTSSSALVATIIAAIITLVLATVFAKFASLAGLGSEEATYIRQAAEQAGVNLNLYNLLIASIIIGSLGALVDSTIAQAAVVRELSRLGPELPWQRLYAGGMSVGFDHIGSLINTLVLAYAGGALPLFVLFSLSDFGFARAVNLETIATEIVKALVGSIGLVLAVPIATVIAAFLFAGNRRPVVVGETNMHKHGWQPPQDESAARLEAQLNPPRPQKSGLLGSELLNKKNDEE